MMTKTEMIKNFGALKTKADAAGSVYIDEICELIDGLPEKNLGKVATLNDFISKWTATTQGGSRLDDINKELESVHKELKKQMAELQEYYKRQALREMRGQKKKRSIAVIVFLSLLTGAVLVLGILSAFEVIPAVWCNIIGVLDCSLGLIFFIYEYCDDKEKEANINAGDGETVKKYVKTTGDITNSGAGSVNITGKVKGNITVDGVDLGKLFK